MLEDKLICSKTFCALHVGRYINTFALIWKVQFIIKLKGFLAISMFYFFGIRAVFIYISCPDIASVVNILQVTVGRGL